jgi:Tol biopolymer transport system component
VPLDARTSALQFAAVIRAGLLAVFLVAAFATGCGGHGRAAGTVVFQGSANGRAALYAVRPDGGGLTRLPLDLPVDGADVFWTQDGSKALVTYGDGAVASVFEPASRTRRSIRLPGLNVASDMPWSPDGKRLVLATKERDVVVDVETGVRRYVRDELNTDLVTWSADGKALLFPLGRAVYAAPADGGPPRRLMRLAQLEPVGLQLSSDGKWISFEHYGVRDELYVVRTNGTGLRLIGEAESSSWSPTGERLVFVGYKGIVLVDLEDGRRLRLSDEHLDDPQDEGAAWSPDGRRILYPRNDLGYGAVGGGHMQLWTMKADGTDRHPLTHGFPADSAAGDAAWIDATVTGTPPPRLPLVAVRAARTITTGLPIVALGAEGNRAAVAQGFGGPPASHNPVGPIVVWNRLRGTSAPIPVHGCRSVYDVLLAAGRVGYRCDNPGNGYSVDDYLRVGTSELVQTHADEFSGSILGGLVADGGTVAFDVEDAGTKSRGEFRIHRTRVWKATRTRKAIVRTFRGEATVASLDGGRIAVLRERNAVSVLSPGGRIRTFGFGRPRILGAELDGPRLLVLQGKRLTVLDLRSGRRAASWPVRRGFGPVPELEDAQGDLAAYVVGAAVHVLRLYDGREFVIDTPNATEPVFARFVPSGLFYAFNESYRKRPGRLVFVARAELERALASRAARR